MALTADYEPSPWEPVREQVEVYERSGGTEGNTMLGRPVIILTTVGAKSGKVRKTPLMRVEHGGRYAAVASLGGAPEHPLWYHNVVAAPHVQLQDGPTPRDYLARELSGQEREEWWARGVEAFPQYDDYRRKTDRVIPVFVLEPVG